MTSSNLLYPSLCDTNPLRLQLLDKSLRPAIPPCVSVPHFRRPVSTPLTSKHARRPFHLCQYSHKERPDFPLRSRNTETGAFIRSTFTYIDDYDRAWFGQTNAIRKYDLTVQDLNRLLQRVPDEKIYPLKTTTISVVSEENRSKLYIKRPKLLCLDNEEETKLLPQMLLGEAEVLQFLEQNPHPNVIRFHGCTINRGRFTGIALEKHRVILQYRHEDVPSPPLSVPSS